MSTTTTDPNKTNCCETEKVCRKPNYKINETNDSWTVKVSVPGVDKSGVSLSVEDNLLLIETQSSDSVDETWKLLSDESLTNDYCLKLSIGKNVDQEKITATVTDGILDVTLPKLQSIRKRTITIN